MKWAEFKKKLEEQGITDDTDLAYIDWQDHGDPVLTPADEEYPFAWIV